MIAGIGTDIIDIRRIKKAIEKPHFLQRIYTEEEILQTKGRIESLAGNFAVKEAVAKALGTGFYGFWPKDIEVLRGKSGAPYIKLYGNALNKMKEEKITHFFVSISHEKEYAIAYVIAEKRENIDKFPAGVEQI